MNDACANIAKQSISAALGDRLKKLEDRAHDLAQRTVGKLDPVMRQEPPCDKTHIDEAQEEYPPLFEDYRNRLHGIENAMGIIDSCIRRCEV